jgi:hypothetical protein
MALVTTQSKPFVKLVELQEKSLNTLNKIKDSVAKTADQSNTDGQMATLDQLKQILDVNKNLLGYARKAQDKSNKDMADLTKSMKGWKTWGDKIRDISRSAAEAVNPANIQKKMFGAFNVGGMFNQKIKANEYVQKRKALGDDRDDKTLKRDGKLYAANQRKAMLAQQGIDRLKSLGASDDDIANSKNGKALLAKRNSATGALGRLDNPKSQSDQNNKMGGNVSGQSVPLPKTPSDKGKVSQSTTDLLADQQSSKENQLESVRQLGLQTDLLTQIAANTASLRKGGSSSAGGAEDSGNSAKGGDGMLSGLGKGLKGIGGGIGSLGKGIGAAIGGIFAGIMGGIADGIAMFGSGKVLKGVAVLGLLSGVIYAMSSAFQTFDGINWDSVTKGLAAIAGVALGAALIGKVIDKILLGAAGIAALGASLWVVGQAFQAVGDGFDSMTAGLTKLSKLDGGNLFSVAGGIAAIGVSLAAFGAGSVAAGLGTLVGNLLTIGQDSPIQQLQKLSDMGDTLNTAAGGIDAIGHAMVGFSKIDKDSIKAVNDFPWLRATAFVAAGGSMSVQGASVTQASKSNADNQAVVNSQASAPAAGASVNTAIQNNTTNNQSVKLPARNIESSQSKYLASRY